MKHQFTMNWSVNLGVVMNIAAHTGSLLPSYSLASKQIGLAEGLVLSTQEPQSSTEALLCQSIYLEQTA